MAGYANASWRTEVVGYAGICWFTLKSNRDKRTEWSFRSQEIDWRAEAKEGALHSSTSSGTLPRENFRYKTSSLKSVKRGRIPCDFCELVLLVFRGSFDRETKSSAKEIERMWIVYNSEKKKSRGILIQKVLWNFSKVLGSKMWYFITIFYFFNLKQTVFDFLISE